MVITCISSSNVVHAKENSTSLKVCKLIRDIVIKELSNKCFINIIPLVDYIAFPVKNVVKDGNSIFPVQQYDWEDIERRIKPLVVNVLKSILNT